MGQVEFLKFAPLALDAARGADIAPRLEALIRAGVRPEAIGRWARRHKIAPLFAGPLHKLGHGSESGLPKPAYYVSHQLHLRQQLHALDQSFAAVGANAMLLKGAVYIYRPIYPRQGLRQIGDLDLLIRDDRALAAFTALGYMSADPEDPFPQTLDLAPGEHHLTPIWRERDAVRVEPHVLPARTDLAHLIDDCFARSTVAPDCQSLMLPDPVDQMVLALVHGLMADRDSMHGGIFMRSIIELELLFEKLQPEQCAAVQAQLYRNGAGKLWQRWRALADWALHGESSAPWRSLGSALLVAEVQLRERGQWGTILAALANQALSFGVAKSWRSGRAQIFLLKLAQGAFWQRFLTVAKQGARSGRNGQNRR